MRKIGFFLSVICIFLMNTSYAIGAGYGPYEEPEPSPDILVDKKVGVPYTTDSNTTDYKYYDNLSSTDHRFREKDYVFFMVRVKNTSNKTLNDVVVRDYKPAYLDLIEDPGTRDGDDLVIKVGTLKAGEEKTYYIRARVVDSARLTMSNNISCVINKVRASNPEVSDEDTSQLCLEKEVTTETPENIPSTGPAENILALIFSGIGLFIGKKLRKSNI